MNQHKLIPFQLDYLDELYQWKVEDNGREFFTCRPLTATGTKEDYKNQLMNQMQIDGNKMFLLIDSRTNLIGKINLFDFNSRNRSAEFGYYLPKHHRSQGLGKIMVKLFLDRVFSDQHLSLNKIYTTTSSVNIPSIRILENFNFILEGRLREHYWIQQNKYDQLIFSLFKDEWQKLKNIIN